jgi:hypothetical protein
MGRDSRNGHVQQRAAPRALLLHFGGRLRADVAGVPVHLSAPCDPSYPTTAAEPSSSISGSTTSTSSSSAMPAAARRGRRPRVPAIGTWAHYSTAPPGPPPASGEGPRFLYEEGLAAGTYRPDPLQAVTVSKLQVNGCGCSV